MNTKEITIKSKLYDYSVELVDDFPSVIDETFDKQTTTYVIDKNVFQLYRNRLNGIDTNHLFLMEPIESKKNMDTVMEMIAFWKSIDVKKNWKVVCIGGGITQDVTTIASNLFLRNIDWFFFPTTLLSMSDSCIGGKCGINFAHYKNQIGVFYPPKKVYIDVSFIETLQYGDYLNGWGELLKFSLTRPSELYNRLVSEESYIPCDRIADYILEGLDVKKEIIELDEFESDLRRVLNYGHTFGHALEAYTENRIPHGQGVIWGIDVVNYIAQQEGLIAEEYYLEIKALIKRAFLKDEIVVENPKELFDIIKTDKKATNDRLSFAMLNGRSQLIVYPMNLNEKLERMFMEYLKTTHEYYCN